MFLIDLNVELNRCNWFIGRLIIFVINVVIVNIDLIEKKMIKCKEYMEIVEKVVCELVIVYYNEYGKFFDRYSVFKFVLICLYKNMLLEVSDIIYKYKE